jgi:hypothetical protein
MSELYPSDADLNALSGTADAEQGVAYPTIFESPYYTTFYKMLYRLLDVARRAGDLRVCKDGDLTFEVKAGRYFNGDTAVDCAAASAQALTDDATNYIYLTAAGVLTVNTTGFPVPSVTPHIPLASITTGSASAAGVSGEYSHEDITDYRGRAFLTTCSGLTAADMAEAAAFFQNTDITGAEAETLTNLSNADTLHVHGAPGLEDGAVTTPKIIAGIEAKAAAYEVQVLDRNKIFTNEGAAAEIAFTFHADAIGPFTFIIQDSDGLKLTAPAGKTIRAAGEVSIAAGYVKAATVGNVIRIVRINSTEFIAMDLMGTWTVETS